MSKKIIIGSAIFLSMVGIVEYTGKCRIQKLEKLMWNQNEIDNHCSDLLNYLSVDLEEGRIDSTTFKSYTWNINEIKRRNNE